MGCSEMKSGQVGMCGCVCFAFLHMVLVFVDSNVGWMEAVVAADIVMSSLAAFDDL